MGSDSKNGRSTLEKILFFTLVLNMAAVIALAVYVGMKDDVNVTCTLPAQQVVTSQPQNIVVPPGQALQRDVCTTPACVTAASNILQSIDDNVSPCDDFYQFACGKWEARFKIPEAKSRYSTFTRIADNIDITLQAQLETPVASEDKDYIKKAKNLYASCMDIAQINSQGKTPLTDLLEELGGWPMVNDTWDEQNSPSLTDLLLRVSRYNLLPLMQLFVATDLTDPDKTNLHLDQTGFGLPGENYYNISNTDNIKYVEAYKTFIYKVANKVGKCSWKDVNDTVDFETELSKIVAKEEDRREPQSMNNPQRLEDINANLSIAKLGLNFTKYTVDMMAMEGLGFDVTEDEVIINQSPKYFEKLRELLEKSNKSVITNYVVWRSVMDNIGMLSTEFRQLFTDYRKVVNGLKSDFPRDNLCLNYVNQEMGFAAGRLFLDHMFSLDARTKANEMVANLKSAFKQHLGEIQWMDSTTRQQAVIKSQHIEQRLGYPDSNKNDKYLSDMYGATEIKVTTFFKNVLNTKHRQFIEDASGFRKPNDKSKWSDPPQTVNAYYSPDKNQITFPGGILQPPFFHPDFPSYLNYGGMGMVIGHEITHGFDDQGRKYDLNGKLANWWTNATSKNYDEKVKCIIDQYSQFFKTIGGKDYHLNGVTTQGENIADNGGIKMSFQAYKTWEANQAKPEPGLPGLPYTNHQLFFINFGQSFCNLARDEHVIKLINTDPHPPGQFRIRGVAKNMPDFGQVFGCWKGSPMNPVDKCSVW